MLLLLMPLGRVLTLPLAGGAVALSGQAASFSLTEPLGCGAFALSGETAAFRSTHLLSAAYGAFAFTGEPATLRRSRTFSAAYGAFALTGEPATFRSTRIFPAASGVFAFTGEPVGAGLSKSSSCGFFTLLGEPAYLFVSYPVPLVAIAKFSWRMQGLSPIVAAPARATFYWKV